MDKVIIRNSSPKLYNTPVEVGVRCLVILTASQTAMDIDKLMYFDFISLNSQDFSGPPSLHAPIKNRGVQIYARKELIKRGLTLLLSKELVNLNYYDTGFTYSVNDLGKQFLSCFATEYYFEFTKRARWAISTFNSLSTGELAKKLHTSLLTWGGEFASDENLIGTV